MGSSSQGLAVVSQGQLQLGTGGCWSAAGTEKIGGMWPEAGSSGGLQAPGNWVDQSSRGTGGFKEMQSDVKRCN